MVMITRYIFFKSADVKLLGIEHLLSIFLCQLVKMVSKTVKRSFQKYYKVELEDNVEARVPGSMKNTGIRVAENTGPGVLTFCKDPELAGNRFYAIKIGFNS